MLRAHGGIAFLAVVLLLTGSCKTEPGDVIAYAFVAPTSINLRPSLTDRSTSVAVLNHGDRVQILEVRRRFAKIRSAKGAEGWIDATQLLTPGQMEEIRKAATLALKLPSEGSATVFEALNIHLDPSRQSPAFARIPDAGSVEVLAHRLAPKVTGPAKVPAFTLLPNADTTARKERKERRSRNAFHLPARPPAPKAPGNWLDLSTGGNAAAPSRPAISPRPPAQTPADPKKPVVLEDWSLVRTKDKQCGWVLSRNLIMSIPDEVAQYAEGKRITSYFDLGVVQDEEKGPRHNWLWTTSSQPRPEDFDGWRLFLWNRHRHRYETSYRERDVEGYFPVHVDVPDDSSPFRTFDLILKGDDGKLVRKHYLFDGVRVHLTGQEPCDPGKLTPAAPVVASSEKPPQRGGGWLKNKLQDLRKRVGATR